MCVAVRENTNRAQPTSLGNASSPNPGWGTLAEDKTFDRAQIITFVRIEVDTVLMEARLPQDKLDKC